MLHVALAVHQICYLPLVFASMVSIERCTHRGENKRQLTMRERRETAALARCIRSCVPNVLRNPRLASHPLIPYRLFHPAQQKCVTARRLHARGEWQAERSPIILIANLTQETRACNIDWVSWDARSATHIINNYFFSAEVAPRIKRCELRH
jgi:hypothetical protein